jgi:hypothetical protein
MPAHPVNNGVLKNLKSSSSSNASRSIAGGLYLDVLEKSGAGPGT